MFAFVAQVLLMSTSATPASAESPVALADLEWIVVNDNVMGGRSEGGFETDNGELGFAGSTNTNGGGFSSIRSRPVQADLSAFEGIQLRVRGDGRRYTWRLTTDARWMGRELSLIHI